MNGLMRAYSPFSCKLRRMKKPALSISVAVSQRSRICASPAVAVKLTRVTEAWAGPGSGWRSSTSTRRASRREQLVGEAGLFSYARLPGDESPPGAKDAGLRYEALRAGLSIRQKRAPVAPRSCRPCGVSVDCAYTAQPSRGAAHQMIRHRTPPARQKCSPASPRG